jgi:hypothetical protein
LPVYFHAAPVLLRPNSIVEPGNWARFLHNYDPEGQHLIRMYREMALEGLRQAICPDKPSRLDCLFACQTHQDLIAFCQAQKRIHDVHYAVEPIDPAAPIHLADYRLISVPARQAGISPFNAIRANARAYWAVPPQECIEVLIGGPVRVLGRLA